MNTLPDDLDFSEIFKKHVEHIEKTKEILQYIDDRPTLILTDLFNPKSERPYYDTSFYLIGMEYSIRYHTFQQYLILVLKDYFKPDCSIRTQENKYPSSVEIIFDEDDEIIMDFNFYNHTYSLHNKKEVNRLFMQKHMVISNLKKAKENMKRYHSLTEKGKPQDFVEKISYVFIKKKILKSLNELLELRTKELDSATNDLMKFQAEQKQFKEKLERHKDKQAELVDFFNNLHYTHKDEIDTSKKIQFILNDEY